MLRQKYEGNPSHNWEGRGIKHLKENCISGINGFLKDSAGLDKVL